MSKPLLIAASVVICLAFTAEAPARSLYASERPTFRQGRDVMHTILDVYARGTDGHLVLGGCRRHAKMWIVCRARVDYRHSVARYRFRISRSTTDYLISTSITTIRR